MGTFLLRVEGVNFDATVYNTNDISTIRGGSLALLDLGDVVRSAVAAHSRSVETYFSGASQVALIVKSDGRAEDLHEYVAEVLRTTETLPLCALTTVVDVVEIEGEGKDATEIALKKAEARNKARQFRQWTVEPQPFDPNAKEPDQDDGVRPAVSGTKKNAQEERKRDFGKIARQEFYEAELGEAGDWDFTDSLQDLASYQAKDEDSHRLAENVRNKIAIFYADGNSFSKLRKGKIKEFGENLTPKRRDLLRKIVDFFDNKKADDRYAVTVDGKRCLRLETLLWGGDEMLFAVPGWLALEFSLLVSNELKDWEFEKKPLTHAMGVVIAHYKTPIRQLRSIAKWSADAAKEAGFRDQNTLTLDIFESVAPPEKEDEFKTIRQERYSKTDPKNKDKKERQDLDEYLAKYLPWCLALPADELCATVQRLQHLCGKGDKALPRSQLYKALRKAMEKPESELIAPEASDDAEKSLNDYEKRMGRDGLVSSLREAIAYKAANEEAPDERPLALTLAMIAELWDYLPPPSEENTTSGAETAQ